MLSYDRKRRYGSGGFGVAPGGAVQFRADSSVLYATRTNTNLITPGVIPDNDYLQIIFEIGALNPPGPPVPTPPAGFNIIAGYPLTRADSNGFTVDTYAWNKLAAAEAGDYLVTHANAASNAYLLDAFGQNLITPLSPAPTTNTGLGDTATAPGLITPLDNCLILYFCSKWNFPGGTFPGGVTPVFTTRLDGSASLLFTSTGNMSPAGATGNKIATALPNTPTEPWASGLFCIQP